MVNCSLETKLLPGNMKILLVLIISVLLNLAGVFARPDSNRELTRITIKDGLPSTNM